MMADSEIEGRTTTTHLEFGPPKYQATVREFARSELGVDDLEYNKGETAEKVVVKAELEVIEKKKKDLK